MSATSSRTRVDRGNRPPTPTPATFTSPPDRAEPQNRIRFAVLCPSLFFTDLSMGRTLDLSSHGRQPSALRLTIVPAGDSIRPPRWDEGDPAVHARRNADGSIWAYSYANGAERWMHLPGIAS